MADADGDLPSLFQLVGPRFRRGEARDNAVTVGAAPSRPILRASVLNDEGEESKQQCRFQCFMIEHSLIIFQLPGLAIAVLTYKSYPFKDTTWKVNQYHANRQDAKIED